MTKTLNGSELVGYIKERQARQVRALRQASHIFPRLVIIKSVHASEVIDVYVRMKQKYAEDILIETEVETVEEADMVAVIMHHNDDPLVHGIIVQLPLSDASLTDAVVDAITPEKDVDGLGKDASFDSATAAAITWLLAGYGVELKNKVISLVGNGRLVGAPLARIWRQSGLEVNVFDETTPAMPQALRQSDIVITAAGVPRLITSDMIAIGAVVVDAGTVSENGVIVGDVDPALRERDDVSITPLKGGVGPLTIAMLFDHVIQSAQLLASVAQKE